MSHRNSKPKPNATERTWRRYRQYHEISTPQDEAHFRRLDEVKNQILEWFGKTPTPQPLTPKINGRR